MSATFYKFVFIPDISPRFVEDGIACAIFLAEHAFGKARVRIDASTEVGRYIAEQLADTFIKLKGDQSFELFRVDEWKLQRSRHARTKTLPEPRRTDQGIKRHRRCNLRTYLTRSVE